MDIWWLNINLHKTFGIYINDKQPTCYFTSNKNQSFSNNQLDFEIKHVNQMNLPINQLKYNSTDKNS